MRVALLKSQINARGGLEKYTLRLAKAFAEKGLDVVLLTSAYDGKTPAMPPGVAAVNLGKRRLLSVACLLEFNRACSRWLRSNPQDIVFGMDRNPSQTHYRAGNGVHAAYLQLRCELEPWYKTWSFALNPLHRKLLQLEKQAFEDVNLKILFTNSHYVKQQILDLYATDPGKIEVVHNGVEWHEMQAAFDQWPTEAGKLKSALKRDPSSLQLLFAGHGYLRKGLSCLLEGLAICKRRDIQLSVVGKDRNLQRWIRRARELGLGDQVAFYGPQPSLKPFLQMADVLTVPSLYDPFANVTVEGLAMGLSVVSSPMNGASEILTSETGVVLSDLFDPECVAAALDAAYAKRKTLTTAQAIRASVKHLDFSSQLEKIVTLTIQEPPCGDIASATPLSE